MLYRFIIRLAADKRYKFVRVKSWSWSLRCSPVWWVQFPPVCVYYSVSEHLYFSVSFVNFIFSQILYSLSDFRLSDSYGVAGCDSRSTNCLFCAILIGDTMTPRYPKLKNSQSNYSEIHYSESIQFLPTFNLKVFLWQFLKPRMISMIQKMHRRS